MKSFEIIARRAEDYAREKRTYSEKIEKTQGYGVTLKDTILNRILDCISWIDRLPGSKEKKAPYVKRMWDSYFAAQSGTLNDTTVIPQMLGGGRMEYLEDHSVETSIADNGIGTGGLGYASVRSQDIGTAYRGKQADPYFRKVKGSPARTLEGEEKAQAYADYLRNKE